MFQKALAIGMAVFCIGVLAVARQVVSDPDELNGGAWTEFPDSAPETPGEQAIGFYTNGRLVNPSRIENEGTGFIKILRPRERRYASKELIELVTGAAAEVANFYNDGEKLQFGDFAQHDGGPVDHHGSHQNGLDVDIAFFRKNHTIQDPNDVSGFAESFVSRGKLTPNFDTERNWELIKVLVASGIVNRIFVDPVIKKGMCTLATKRKEYAQNIETLRRLRPYPNHMDHMHVRIVCPKASPRCVAQDEPPAGSGCDSL